jgi:hypothetical protein
MGSQKFVRIKWASSLVAKDVPFKEKHARVMAVCPDSRMIHLQPWGDDGAPCSVSESPWINLNMIASLCIVPSTDVVKTVEPETVDIDAPKKS